MKISIPKKTIAALLEQDNCEEVRDLIRDLRQNPSELNCVPEFACAIADVLEEVLNAAEMRITKR